MRTRVIAATVALYAACDGATRQPPPAKVAGVRVVDVIPVSLSGETWQDAEPFMAYSARNGSASCHVSPLSDTGITSTTRTPATLAGGGCRVAPSQAAYRATVAAITLVRMS